MEYNNQNNSFIKKQNKGFTIHVGDTYVGHLVINEDRVNAHTLSEMQKPEVMGKILASAELRKFVPAEERANRDTSPIDAIIASVDSDESADDTDADAGSETEQQTAQA